MVWEVADSELRKRHRALVLGVLRAAGPLPKAEIGRRLDLSVPTVTEILRGFEADRIVVPAGEGQSSGGRRPMLYGLRTDGLRGMGVNVDHDRISAVISDLSGTILTETTVQVDFADGEEAFVGRLRKAVERALATDAAQGLAGIGIAVPTTMRRSGGGRFSPLGHPEWTGVDLPAVLEEHYRLPVVVENRAHAVGVGEYLFGAGQGCPHLLCLVLGSGLGAAIIAGGRLFTGGDGGAGALGRMFLDLPHSSGAPPDLTVSDRVGAEGIVGSAAQQLRNAGRTTVGVGQTEVPLERVDVDHVIDAAIAGDRLMAAVLAEVGHVLAAVVAATLCVTDSELVLLCGPTMRAGGLIVEPLRESLQSRFPFALPRIRMGQLGTHAGPLGAAALVLTDHVTDAGAGTVTR